MENNKLDFRSNQSEKEMKGKECIIQETDKCYVLLGSATPIPCIGKNGL